MEKQESLTTSESLENAVFDGRLDIPVGAKVESNASSTRRGGAHGDDGKILLHNPVRPRAQPAQPVSGTPCRGNVPVPIDTVLLKAASRCNIACSYCYVYQLGDQGWQRQPPAMSQSTIDAIVSRLDELRQAQGRDFAVVLHGGEPLLLGEALLARLLTGLRTRLPVGCTLSVQTNGTLLTDSLLDLFADAGATVSVSLDGPTKINDSRRMRFDQGGTFEATLGGIHCLQRHPAAERLFSGTLSVVEPSTDPSVVYWFLRGLGVPGMNFLLPRREPLAATARQDRIRFARSGGMAGGPLRCLHE